MSKKWSPTDLKHFDGKSLRELEEMLKQAERFVDKYPQFQYGWHNEYRQRLRQLIAEQIGKSK